MANSKVVIDILSPNERTFNMLEFVLQQHGKGRFELGRGNRPDLVIVDCDKPEAKAAFGKYRVRFPKIPAVLLLNQPAEYDEFPKEDRVGAEFILCKPFAAKDFISRIDECLGAAPAVQAKRDPARTNQPNPAKLATVDGTRVVKAENSTHRNRDAAKENTQPLQIPTPGNPLSRWAAQEDQEVVYSFALESDIDMADDAAVKEIWLQIDDTLLGQITRAMAQQISAQSTICLALHPGLSFYITPSKGVVAAAGENIDLLALARQDRREHPLSVSEGVLPETKFQFQLGLEDFLWTLALYTYRGRLPEGTKVNEPVYLRYWPNLTRLEPTHNAMRIAALWSRQPVALAYLVRILNIPQRHVFNFFAAAHTIGIAGLAIRDADKMLLNSLPDEMDYSVIPSLDDKLVSPKQKIS